MKKLLGLLANAALFGGAGLLGVCLGVWYLGAADVGAEARGGAAAGLRPVAQPPELRPAGPEQRVSDPGVVPASARTGLPALAAAVGQQPSVTVEALYDSTLEADATPAVVETYQNATALRIKLSGLEGAESGRLGVHRPGQSQPIGAPDTYTASGGAFELTTSATFASGEYELALERPAPHPPFRYRFEIRKQTLPRPEIDQLHETIGGQSYRWTQSSPVLITDTLHVTIKNASLPKGTEIVAVRLQTNGPPEVIEPVQPIASASDGTLRITVQVTPSGSQQIAIRYRKGDVIADSAPIRITVPGDASEPHLTRVATNPFADPKPLNEERGSNLYGRLVRVAGTATPGVRLHFVLFRKEDGSHVQIPAAFPVQTTARADWELPLEMPSAGLPDELHLFVRAESSQGHRYEDKPLILTSTGGERPPIPVIQTVVKTSQTDSVGARTSSNVYVNSSSVRVTVKPSGNVPADTYMVLFAGDDLRSPLAGASVVAVPDANPVSVDWQIPQSGRYAIRAVLVQGPLLSIASEPVGVHFRDTPPRPIDVDPENFALAPDPNVVAVRFDPLNPVAVAPESSFALVPKSGQTLQPADVPMISEGGSLVTLRFPPIPPELYTLEVKQGIVDVFGNQLQQTARFTIVKPVGSDLPVVAPGLRGPQAPFVEFPEYVPPREPVDGFNPSDKVVTRVARLYYLRDAHRVAQIINRRARSYNQASVDTVAQLADRAGMAADQKMIERRALEVKAIQAAQAARQVEADLRQAHEDLQSKRAAAAQAQQTNLQFQTAHQSALVNQPIVEGQQNAAIEENRAAILALQQRLAAAPPQPPAEVVAIQTEIEQRQAAIIEAQTRMAAVEQLRVRAERAAADAERAQQALDVAQGQVTALQQSLETLRTAEVNTAEQMQATQAEEDLLRAAQFKREVAAMHADPDTFAPGKVGSIDPVAQVSVTVLGEGEIQLRGPRKGVNEVRLMINQLDAPAGQVRVAIHTVQINGERGERIEPVVARIQRYIDHSRFLTVRSAQMLRNAVVAVASRQAQSIYDECPNETQAFRDRKYLHAFFGEDFIRELETLDSEFLDTGNKLLSLHSMDSTSLASALFLLALAKNDVRFAILEEFKALVMTRLPIEEQEYFLASGAEERFGCKKFQFFAPNARFVSLDGMFDVELQGADTLTPIQREFIKLAQIFKARLVTEIEWNQRVMQRAVIEERVGSYIEELRKARNAEEAAKRALAEARQLRQTQQQELFTQFARFVNAVTAELGAAVMSDTLQSLEKLVPPGSVQALEDGRFPRIDTIQSGPTSVALGGQMLPVVIWRPAEPVQATGPQAIMTRIALGGIPIDADDALIAPAEAQSLALWEDSFRAALEYNLRLQEYVESFELRIPQNREAVAEEQRYLQRLQDEMRRLPELAPYKLSNYYILLINRRRNLNLYVQIQQEIERYYRRGQALMAAIASPDSNVQRVYFQWLELRKEILDRIRHPALLATVDNLMRNVDQGFVYLLSEDIKLQIARAVAQDARRPLDHKKFLDMLVDDVEEKYIELLEGTRAHTANVDNYVQRIATALEDDFNTQFYHPTFRAIRDTSRYWDVQLSAIQTESVLTNNRTFAKVAPQATMEFDLPKRDIVINEAFEAAYAAYSDYGALMGDPNFLALTKLYSGQPPSSPYNVPTPNPLVRDVLPGLPTSSEEHMLVQQPPTPPQFGSQLEALIPDPAIYKFETGTGFEIRPVIQPDGQAVVFHLQYMYTTNVREPVRADEKHLGRVKRHFIDTDVQLGNYELREVSRFQVALKASRTARGVPLLEDVPAVGVLFRPMPQQESSLQENLILAQSTIYPTLFDLMGLRWAQAVADLDPLGLRESEFVTRGRTKAMRDRVFDYSGWRVDDFLRVPPAERRPDLYREQETIPYVHPNGYSGPGLNMQRSHLQEGYDPREVYPPTQFAPSESDEGVPLVPVPGAPAELVPGMPPPGMIPPSEFGLSDGIYGPPAGEVTQPLPKGASLTGDPLGVPMGSDGASLVPRRSPELESYLIESGTPTEVVPGPNGFSAPALNGPAVERPEAGALPAPSDERTGSREGWRRIWPFGRSGSPEPAAEERPGNSPVVPVNHSEVADGPSAGRRFFFRKPAAASK